MRFRFQVVFTSQILEFDHGHQSLIGELLLVPNETPPRLTCHLEIEFQGLPVSGT